MDWWLRCARLGASTDPIKKQGREPTVVLNSGFRLGSFGAAAYLTFFVCGAGARAHAQMVPHLPTNVSALTSHNRRRRTTTTSTEPQSRFKICSIGIVADLCVLRSEYRSMAQLSCVERHAPADEPHKALLRCRPSGELTKLRKRAHTRGC